MPATVWRGHLSFGLISIPVRLYRAARAERVKLRRLVERGKPQRDPVLSRRLEAELGPEVSDKVALSSQPEKDWVPVQNAAVQPGSSRPVSYRDTAKGFEYAKDKFVAIAHQELKSLSVPTSSSMDIGEFVPLDDIDPIFFEASYYVMPEEVGEKAYALLYEALRRTRMAAIAQFAMHSREHVVVIRSGMAGLVVHTMFYVDEVHDDEEYRADVAIVSKDELVLAQKLINSLRAGFEPGKYQDQYRSRLESLIATRIPDKAEARSPGKPPTQVVSISDALRQSLSQLKKKPENKRLEPSNSTVRRGKTT